MNVQIFLWQPLLTNWLCIVLNCDGKCHCFLSQQGSSFRLPYLFNLQLLQEKKFGWIFHFIIWLPIVNDLKYFSSVVVLTHEQILKDFGDFICRYKPIFYKDYIYITSRYLLCSSCKTSIRILKKIKLIDCQLFVPKITSHKILEFLRVVDLVGNAHVRILSDASFNFDSFWKHVKRGLNPCCFF